MPPERPERPERTDSLTSFDVISQACALTGESGLLGWSVRDLAAALGTSTSVIYHHVGGRDEIARRVAEEALRSMTRADQALSWQDWFRVTLFHARQTLLDHPGVAHWLLMHGPAFPGALDIVDTGIAKLVAAGFGERTPFVYSMLFNSAATTIAMSDDRRGHEADGPRDHAAMMTNLATLAPSSPGITSLLEIVRPMAGDQQQARASVDGYYRDLIDTLIAGLEQQLP